MNPHASLLPPEARPATWARWWMYGALLGFAVLASAYAATRAPWWDEGLYADVARQFAMHETLRSTVMAATGTFGHAPLPEMDKYAYWTTPLYPVTVGAWFKAVGVGLWQMRILSLLAAAGMLWAWWHVVRRLSGSPTAAHVAIGLLALSSHVLWISSIGRMESMALALAGAAMTAYLHWREFALKRAVVVSAALFMLAGLAHPLVLVTALGFAAVVITQDWRRIRIGHVLLAAGVGVVLATPWLLYIMQDVDAFRGQWGANAGVRSGGLSDPLRYLITDFRDRYLHFHLFQPQGAGKLRVLELAGMLACFALAVFVPSIRRTPGVRAFLLFSLVSWATLALLDGSRFVQYFAYVIPVYLCVAAVVLTVLFTRGGVARWVAVVLAGLLVAPGAGGIALKARQNAYRTDYLPAVAAVRALQQPGVRIIGPSELAFELGFDGAFVDDMQMRSPADVYVQGEMYLTDTRGEWQTRVRRTLGDEFALVHQSARFKVFARSRTSVDAASATAPVYHQGR